MDKTLRTDRKSNKFYQYLVEKDYSTDKKQEGRLTFMARAMVMATLPHSNPKTHIFERKNGFYTLVMMANPKFGLPYGSIPRILLAWITTEAISKKSPELNLGKSLSSFLKKLNLRHNGGKRGNATRIREQMMRLLTCQISCVYYDKETGTCEGDQYLLSRSFNLWWNPLKTGNIREFLPSSKIILTKDFFDELIKAPIPIDFDALTLLRQSPLQIDIYIWLTYRFSFLTKETFIPWKLIKNQFGSEYANDAQGTRNFKKKFIQALKNVWMVYPSANVTPNEKGLILSESDTHVKKKNKINISVDNKSYPR